MDFLKSLWGGIKDVGSTIGKSVGNLAAATTNKLGITGPLNPSPYGPQKKGTVMYYEDMPNGTSVGTGGYDRDTGKYLTNTNIQVDGKTYYDAQTGKNPDYNKLNIRPSTYVQPTDSSGRKSSKAEGQPYVNDQGFTVIPDRGFSGLSGSGAGGFQTTTQATMGAQGQGGGSAYTGLLGATGTAASGPATLTEEEQRLSQQGTKKLTGTTTQTTEAAVNAITSPYNKNQFNAPDVPDVIDAGYISKVSESINKLQTSGASLSANDRQQVIQSIAQNLITAKQRLDQQNPTPEMPVIDTQEQEAFLNQSGDPFGVKQAMDEFRASNTNLGDLQKTRVELQKNVQALNEAYRPIIKDIKDNPDLPKALARRRLEDLATSQKEVLQGFLDQLTIVNQQVDDQNTMVNRQFQIMTQAQNQQEKAQDNARANLNMMISSGAIGGFTDAQIKQTAASLGIPTSGLLKARDAALDPKVDSSKVDKNGDLVFFDKSGTEVKRTRGFEKPASSSTGETFKSGGLSISGADVSAGVKKLKDSGNDPSVYLQMYNTWIDKGGLPQDFTQAYPPELYINPANTWLPRNLVPKSSTPTLNFSQ